MQNIAKVDMIDVQCPEIILVRGCSCCSLSLLPQLDCNNLATTYKYYFLAQYELASFRQHIWSKMSLLSQTAFNPWGEALLDLGRHEVGLQRRRVRCSREQRDACGVRLLCFFQD